MFGQNVTEHTPQASVFRYSPRDPSPCCRRVLQPARRPMVDPPNSRPSTSQPCQPCLTVYQSCHRQCLSPHITPPLVHPRADAGLRGTACHGVVVALLALQQCQAGGQELQANAAPDTAPFDDLADVAPPAARQRTPDAEQARWMAIRSLNNTGEVLALYRPSASAPRRPGCRTQWRVLRSFSARSCSHSTRERIRRSGERLTRRWTR